MKYYQESKENLQYYTMYMKSKMKLHKQLYMQLMHIKEFNALTYSCLYKKLYLDVRAALGLPWPKPK